MRVLVTHERFLPDFCGGCEYGVYSMARGLQDRGVTVSVLTTGDPQKTQYGGLQTRRLPIHRYRMNLAVEEVMDGARNADLIQTSNYHASLPSVQAGRRLSKPVFLLVTALCGKAWLDMRGFLVGRAYEIWERYLMRQPFSRIIFPSEHSRQAGIAMGIPPSRCVMIHPGFERQKFSPAAVKDNLVLFVGKFDRRKGVFDILEVARCLPEVPFLLLGWGPEESALRRLAPPNASIEVLPPGAVMSETQSGALREAFARASIFFLPSKVESFGLVIVEAMASGCAIVSTVPLEYEGARVSAGDIPAMAKAIRQLWSAPDRTVRMGERNIVLAAQYSWENFTSTLMATYEQTLSGMNCG